MERRIRIFFFCTVLLLTLCPAGLRAQFRSDAFKQNYNSEADSLAMKDSVDKTVDFKEIFGGLAHKRTMRIGSMFGTSVLLPGASQIYNKQYWKLPIFYTGIVGGLAGGITCGELYKKNGDPALRTASIWSYVGAGIFYYASLMDGVACYKSDRKILPGRATVYSILCPGLGQAYNGEYWKIPIYVGGMVGAAHFLAVNNTNYVRFRNIYREANAEGYQGPITATQAKYYRDEYRRYRDYSIVVMAAVYLLQIIDANVFANMHDFDVSDNLSVNISPTVIMPEHNAYASGGVNTPAAGVAVGLRF